jgi:phospholipid/cholesterol/gamma-HCH transport system permease protein
MLVVISDAIGLYGAFLGVNLKQDVSFSLYTHQIFQKLTFNDVLPSIAKSFFFGFAIGAIGSYKGFITRSGTQGVGISANSAVVVSTFVVFLIVLVAAQLADIFSIT